MNKIRKTKLL